MAPLITSLALAISSVALLIPVVGWILFAVLALAITVFMLPFALIFELLRYEDTRTLSRSQSFQSFKGERHSITTWVVIGSILMTIGWSLDLLSVDALARLRQATALTLQRTVLPITTTLMKNQQALSSFMEKINYTYQSPNALDAPGAYNGLQDLK